MKKPILTKQSSRETQDARLRLDAEVKRRKALEDHGQKLQPTMPLQESAAAMGMRGVICAADVFKGVLTSLERISQDSVEFAKVTREKIYASPVVLCEDHQIALLVDYDASIRASWKYRKLVVKHNKCSECERIENELRQKDAWIDMGIPEKVLHATFRNFDVSTDEKKKARSKFLDKIKENKGFIIALGLYGTGKSHLAAATIKHAGSGRFVTLADLIGELRQTYTDHSGQDSLVNKYKLAKVLVLDELSTETKGVDIPGLLYRILAYRHDKDLLTVFTSNEDLRTVLEILGPKLKDRIKANYTVANFTWASHRYKNVSPSS